MSNSRNLSKIIPDSAGKISLATQTKDKALSSNMPSGSVLQVLQYVLNTPAGYSGVGVYAPIISGTITPSSVNSKILIEAFINHSKTDVQYEHMFYLTRNGVQIANSTNPGTRESTLFQYNVGGTDNYMLANSSGNYLDSPSSIATLTYAINVRAHGGTVYINRSILDVESYAYCKRGISTLTLTEIA